MTLNTLSKLDIFIVTYNRADKLDNTLSQILAENSPIKNHSIHVIDNNSSDDTALIVQKHQSVKSNLTYEKNKYNIGGNANIVKAFYKASKEYVWVLADNDDYCWNSWNEVEQEIEKKTDAIVVATYECPRYDVAQLFLQTTFLPGVIYKTSNIDDTVMVNMEFNISNLFPHLALSSKILNENKNIYIVNTAIVNIGNNSDENGNYIYIRGYERDSIHPLQKGMNWLTGYANSLHMIKDRKTRNYIIAHNRFCSELNTAKIFFLNQREAEDNLYNYLCIFSVLSLIDKLKFIINVVLYYTLYRIIYIYKWEVFNVKEGMLTVHYDFRLFYTIKTKFIKFTKNIKEVC